MRGQRGQSYGGNRAEGTGESQRGRPSLCLTMGALCRLKGGWDQGAVCVCVWLCVGADEEAWSHRALPWEMRPLVGEVRAGEEGTPKGLSDKTGVEGHWA